MVRRGGRLVLAVVLLGLLEELGQPGDVHGVLVSPCLRRRLAGGGRPRREDTRGPAHCQSGETCSGNRAATCAAPRRCDRPDEKPPASARPSGSSSSHEWASGLYRLQHLGARTPVSTQGSSLVHCLVHDSAAPTPDTGPKQGTRGAP